MTEPHPTRATPAIGSTLDQLDTPCLLLDLDIFERNVRHMSEYCRSHGVGWRPHAKCHKSRTMARQLTAAGAMGLTCAKLGEAEVMASAGVNDLLIANPVVGPLKLKRLVELRRVADPIVVVDHEDHVTAISAAAAAGGVTIRTIIEVDIGLARCGTAPGEPTVELARRIDSSPGLELAGIMGYEGHLLIIADLDEKERQIAAAMKLLSETRDAMKQAGLPCDIVSAGGTASYVFTACQPGITEIQAGGGIFMDVFYREQGKVPDLEFALRVLTTVTSRPAPDRAIIDAGRKTMSQEVDTPVAHGRDDLRVVSLSAEHGSLEVLHGPGPAIGERIEFIPGYGDLTTVLHDYFYCTRGGKLEAIWPLEARGRLE